jgi:hypothetical protein
MNMNMKHSAAFLFALLAVLPGYARAATCEQGFVKSGSPIGGLKFTASIQVADLSPASAIGQMRGIVLPRGYDILTEEAEEGSMLIEQPATGKTRSFPIIVTATSAGRTGNVELAAKLRGGMLVKEELAKTEMCSILNQIKGGKAGLVAAARAKSAVAATAAPLSLSALSFSQQISKETERNPAAIPLRYKGKSFTINGPVDYITRDGAYYRVAFKIYDPYIGSVKIPGSTTLKTDISCLMAKGQNAYALTLKPNKNVKLTGTYRDFDEYRHVIWLQDCRPAN